MGFPGGAVVKNLPANAGDATDAVSIPGCGRSSEVGNGNLHKYSCLENSMDRGSWWATVHGIAESNVTEHTHTHTHTQRAKDQGRDQWVENYEKET